MSVCVSGQCELLSAKIVGLLYLTPWPSVSLELCSNPGRFGFNSLSCICIVVGRAFGHVLEKSILLMCTS